VKGKLLIILSGVALLHLFLLGGLALTGGCSSDQDEKAIDEQNYVPAPTAEAPAVPATNTPPAVTDFGPAAPATATPGLSTPSPLTAPQDFGAPKAEASKYTVQKGDNPWKIAKKYGVSVDEIMSYNQLKSAKDLKVGQVLTIPPGGKLQDGYAAPTAAGAKTASAGAKKHTAAAPAPAATAKAKKDSADHAATEAAPSGSADSYAVQKGDSVDKIAKKFHVKASDIESANNLTDKSVLKIGQKLTIPKAGATAAKADAKDDSAKADGKDAAKDSKSTAKKHAKTDKDASKADAKADASKDAAAGKADSGKAAPKTDSLLEEIPSPDAPAASAPLANSSAMKSATDLAGEKPVSSATTTEIDQDTTVEKLASQYGCKADDIKKLNPELSADGKIKAGSVVKIP